MKFVTNCIQTGKGKSFDDFVASVLKKEVKVASTAEEVVKIAEEEEAESSGQLDVEPLHQKGESTEMPKKGPSAKKEAKSSEKDEADSSGQPEWEGKKENNNEPEVCCEKGGSSTETTKAAGSECCETCKKPSGLCKCKKEEGEKEKEASGRRFVKIANLDSKNKAFLRKFWGKIYGEAFVNALLADK